MNLRLYIVCIAAVLTLVAPAVADSNNTATVRGEIYGWDTFEPLENAVVEVNSTPSQSMVAKYSVYSFELVPGNYSITAKYYQNSTLLYSGEEIVEIKDNGDYVKDLLLLPVYSETLMESSGGNRSSESLNTTNKINNSSYASEHDEESGISSSTASSLLVAFALLSLLAGGYQIFRKHKKSGKDPLHEVKKVHMAESTGFFSKLENIPEIYEKVPNKTSEPEKMQNLQASVQVSTEEIVPTSKPLTEPEFKTTVSEHVPEPEQESEPRITVTRPPAESEPEIPEKQGPVERKKEYLTQEENLAGPGPEEENEIISLKESDEPKMPAGSPEIKTPAPRKKLLLPADLQEVMDIIRGQGGRITQKDLRSKLKYSEGKVSLMIADLERRDLLEKFKRGRGNVIILKDEER
jgi:uncharacterized membrane protein